MKKTTPKPAKPAPSKPKKDLSVTSAIGNIRKSANKARDI